MRKILFSVCLIVSPLFAVKHFVLIAAPGSGKGTFSQHLVKKYGYAQICPGDMFRAEIKAQTELGKKIKPLVERGDYVDESIVCELVGQALLKTIKQDQPVIIDGFPRSNHSYAFLHNFLKQHFTKTASVEFVQFLAKDETCLQRIINRYLCVSCAHVYNTSSARPKRDNLCDDCGIELTRRSADTPEVVSHRLNYFHQSIEPLVEQARQSYPLHKIDTEHSLDQLLKSYDELCKE